MSRLLLYPSAVRRLKEAAAGDLLLGGAETAASGLAAGLIEECHIFSFSPSSVPETPLA
jgi:dihydrofolate reductase